MDNQETIALRKAIERWISKHTDTVLVAQRLAKKIMEYGLIDTSQTLPFQILPTTMSDSEGGLICKLFVHLDSPVYGFFSIELENNSCAITCPNMYHTNYFVASHEDCETWIDSLNGEMEIFYQLSSAADEKQLIFCTNTLNEMLASYKKLVSPAIQSTNEKILSFEGAAIISENFYALAKDAQKNLSRAFLIPQSWVVFESLDNLPDQGEETSSYVDDKKTNELFEELVDFQKQESYYAAPIFLAQRICLQAGLDVRGYSSTEDSWIIATSTEELGEFVLPPIDITEFVVK